MTLMSISPLINVVDRWPCTTTTWTSIPVYQDEAWQLCPTSFGSCLVAARERHWMWGGKFWTSQNTLPWSWSSLEHVVNLWLSTWNIMDDVDDMSTSHGYPKKVQEENTINFFALSLWLSTLCNHDVTPPVGLPPQNKISQNTRDWYLSVAPNWWCKELIHIPLNLGEV